MQDAIKRLRAVLGADAFAEWRYAARTWRPAVARRATPEASYSWLVAEGWLHSDGDFTEQFYQWLGSGRP